MVSKIEALLDALGRVNGINDPESECYQMRNILMVRSFARLGKHEVNSEGRRIFTSLLSGYKAALFDLSVKLAGKSRAKVGPDSTLEELLRVYGIKELGGIQNVVSFIRRALKDQSVSRTTKLSFFLDGESEKE